MYTEILKQIKYKSNNKVIQPCDMEKIFTTTYSEMLKQERKVITEKKM